MCNCATAISCGFGHYHAKRTNSDAKGTRKRAQVHASPHERRFRSRLRYRPTPITKPSHESQRIDFPTAVMRYSSNLRCS